MKILIACIATLLFYQSCQTKKEQNKELKSFFNKCDELNIVYYSKDTFVFKTVDTSTIKKNNGNHYIETHHVEQVSTLKKGVLSISNLMTVCANHHRQLHYGQSEIIGQTEHYFIFKLDDREIQVRKIKIS